jgi:hypothetical protein
VDSGRVVPGATSRPTATSGLHNSAFAEIRVLLRKGTTAEILEADWNARTADSWKPHPMFGKMTPKEWGKLLQIHVDLSPKMVRSSAGRSNIKVLILAAMGLPL